jgi:hypothetical protein
MAGGVVGLMVPSFDRPSQPFKKNFIWWIIHKL